MASRVSHRRWLCVLAALLFGISAVTHAYAMTGAAMKMPPPVSDLSMLDHGMDCGGDDMARANCIATCASAIAILCEPVRVPPFVAVANVVAEAPLPLPGRGTPPEPHPPKRFA